MILSGYAEHCPYPCIAHILALQFLKAISGYLGALRRLDAFWRMTHGFASSVRARVNQHLLKAETRDSPVGYFVANMASAYTAIAAGRFLRRSR